MKVAILRNTPDAAVLNALGRKNREYYRESDVEAVRNILQDAGHETKILEADIDLTAKLESFFGPRGSESYRDAFAFNLAYGVQGDCRYTHVPSLLEMAGIPYVGSGPGGHTVCLDKYLAKIVFERTGLPTPACQLLNSPDDRRREDLAFPLVVKPRFESTSFGLRVVDDDDQLREAVTAIVGTFHQPALAEAFVDGMEVNCGLLGNAPPRALPVLEVDFGERTGAEAVLTYEAKRDRVATHVCPARIPDALADRVQHLAIAAFEAAGCRDAARVDFRIGREGRPQILEINSMVAIHADGSYYHAARTLGMSHADLVLGVLEAARARVLACRPPAGDGPSSVR